MKLRTTCRRALSVAALLALAFVLGAPLHAQTNVAPNGTGTNSGGGSGSWGPANLNNNDTSGAQNDCWTSGGGWVQIEWNSPQTIETMKVWYTRYRNLGSQYCFHRGTIQYRDGNGNWQTDQNYDDQNYGSNDDEDITLQQVRTTTAVRISSLYGPSNVMIQEWQIFEPQGPELEVTTTAGNAESLYANAQGANSEGVAIGSFEIECTTQPNGELTEIELEASGSMDASTDIAEMKIFRDDGDNQFDAAADTEIGTLSAFSGPNGTATVSVTGSEQDFQQNQTKVYFVVVKLNGMAAPGETLDITVSDIDVGAMTRKSGVPASPAITGCVIAAPDFELMDMSLQSPTQAVLGTDNNLLQSFSIAYPNGPDNTVMEIGMQASGTGNDATGFSAVNLWLDDGDNSFDPATDANISSQTFNSNDGTLTFTLPSPASDFSEGTTKYFFISGDVGLQAAHGETYRTQITHINGFLAGTNSTGTPAPASGPAGGLEILGNVLDISANGPTSTTLVDNDSSGGNGDGVVLLDFTMESVNDPWTVNSITFQASGTGDDGAAFSELALYEDANANGLFEGTNGDMLAAPAGVSFSADDGLWEVIPDNKQVVKNMNRRFFLVGTFAGTATQGETFSVELLQLNTVAPNGGVTFGLPATSGFDIEIDAASLEATFVGPTSALTVNSNAQDQLLLDFSLSAKNAAFSVTNLGFQADGTGDDASAYSNLKLFEDVNGNGVYEAGTDTSAGSSPSTSFGSDDGTASFTLSSPDFTTPTRHFFLLGDLSGAPITGETYNVALSNVGFTSSASGVTPTGVPSMTSTALVIDQAVLTVANAMDAPPATVVQTSDGITNHVLAKFEMTASNADVNLNGFTLSTTGTGDWVNDLDSTAGVRVFMDDGDGVLDSNIDTEVFSGSGVNGTMVVNLSTPQTLANAQTLTFFVEIQFTPDAGESTPKTYTASILSAGDVQVQTGVMVVMGTPQPISNPITLIDFFISAVSPTSVAPGTFGQAITITGSGFTAPATLTIDGISCGTGTVSNDGTMITGFTVPENNATELTDLDIVLTTGILGSLTIDQKFSYLVPDEGGSASGGCALSGSQSSIWMLALLAIGFSALLWLRTREA